MEIVGYVLLVLLFLFLGVGLWASTSKICKLEKELKDARWMRDYWEGLAAGRGKKED